MEKFLVIALLVVGVILVIAIMMQPSKQQDALDALTGGAGDLFATQKSRGFEAIMERFTAILGGLWMLLALALMFVENH